MIDKGNIHNYI